MEKISVGKMSFFLNERRVTKIGKDILSSATFCIFLFDHYYNPVSGEVIYKYPTLL